MIKDLVYCISYNSFDMYIPDICVGQKGFIYDKLYDEWSEGVVSDVIDDAKNPSAGKSLVASYRGKVKEGRKSYYVGFEAKKIGIDKPDLSIIAYV